MRNLIIVGVIAIILIGGALFFRSNTADAPTNENVQNVEVVPEQKDTTPIEGEGANATEPLSQTVPSTPTAPVYATPASTPKPAYATPATVPSTYAALISFTDTGFEPREVTIKKGQKVRFINNSTKYGMWVAAQFHPTHTNYLGRTPSQNCLGSDFDQCESAKQGEYWDFKFDYVGSWDFHNHVRAIEDGTVNVVE